MSQTSWPTTPSAGINGMDLKHGFGEVQADGGDLLHGLRFLSSTLDGAHHGTTGSGAIHLIVWEQHLFPPHMAGLQDGRGKLDCHCVA